MGILKHLFGKKQSVSAKESRNQESKRVYKDGDSVACEHCGKHLLVHYAKSDKQITLGVAGDMTSIAFRCQNCGYITCSSCALPGGGRSEVPIPVCPSCSSEGGPYFFY